MMISIREAPLAVAVGHGPLGHKEGLFVIVLEGAKHIFNIPGDSSLDFLQPILSFNRPVPLAIGFVLGMLAQFILQSIEAENILADNPQNRVTQRVLVVENQLLLGAGLQGLLSGESALEVFGITPGDQTELVREIRRIRPDVILLDENSCLARPAELLALLENHPKLRVLLVSASDQRVHIYSKQEISVDHLPQLVSIIRQG